MLYRRMPGGDEDLSALGFGCMRLPVQGGAVDEPLATRMLHRAIDAGVNYVDTAWPYHEGRSEEVVGAALAGGHRARVRLVTKLPNWLVHSRADMDRLLDAQLARLRTDHLDYYLVHAVDFDRWEQLQALGIREFLEACVRDGRVRHVGFSSHDTLAGVKRLVDAYPWSMCLLQLNFYDVAYQAGVEGLAYAAAKGLGVVAMEPLRGGMLARPGPAVVEAFRRARPSWSAAEWGLRWAFDRPEISVVLSGMSAPEQLEENLRVAAQAPPKHLTAGDQQVYEEVRRLYAERLKVDCTGCGYCMPCPAGVDIPECFSQYNTAFVFEDVGYARRLYGFRAGEEAGAHRCVRCGECLAHCPQKIAIPDRLEDVARLFK